MIALQHSSAFHGWKYTHTQRRIINNESTEKERKWGSFLVGCVERARHVFGVRAGERYGKRELKIDFHNTNNTISMSHAYTIMTSCAHFDNSCCCCIKGKESQCEWKRAHNTSENENLCIEKWNCWQLLIEIENYILFVKCFARINRENYWKCVREMSASGSENK